MTQQSDTNKLETVELEFDDKQLLEYMLAAHEADMSFNQFVNTVIKEFLNVDRDEE